MKRDSKRLLFCFAALASLLFASCGTMLEDPQKPKEEKKEEKKKDEKKKDRFAFLRKEEKKKITESYETLDKEQVVQKEPAVGDEVTADQLKKLQQYVTAPAKKATSAKDAASGAAANLPFYEDFIVTNADEELDVSLIFNSAPLLDVLSAFADLLGFNFVADNSLKGVVTINLNSKMTRRELWNAFERMLALAGATVKNEDSVLRIMANSKLAQQADQMPGRDADAEILYFPLSTATAQETLQQLKQFLSPGATCVALTRPNAVLVCDTHSAIPKLRELLTFIDRSGRRNWPRAVIRCRNILPSKIVTELREVLPSLGFSVYQTTDRTELPGAVMLSGLDRMQIITATAANEEAVSLIRDWIVLLDSSDASDQERVFIYKVRHNKAANLARALTVIYDTQGSVQTIDTTTGKTRTDTLNSATTRRNTNTNNRNAANSATSTQTDKRSKIFENTIKVFADGTLNRLVIRTTPRTYASIKALLDRLDVVPAQVLLQVLIVEVSLTESTQFGLEFSGYSKGGDVNTLFGTNYANNANNPLNPFTESGSFKTGSARQDGATFVISNPNNPQERFGYIRAMAGNGLVRVLSSPQILVSSHTEANVTVGKNVPVLLSGSSNTQSTGTSLQSYTYKETGVILTVTPQITSSDLISMEVKQVLSQAVSNDVTPEIKSPVFTNRSIETSMTIGNGQTMVIGGLIQEMKTDDLDSIPFVKQVPFLNRLLGSTNASTERTEILMLITGTIINEQSPVEEMIKRYNDAVSALNEFDSKMGDRPQPKEKGGKTMFFEKDFWVP